MFSKNYDVVAESFFPCFFPCFYFCITLMQIIYFYVVLRLSKKKNLESRNLTHGRYFEMLA